MQGDIRTAGTGFNLELDTEAIILVEAQGVVTVRLDVLDR